jgi:hypothetical protein
MRQKRINWLMIVFIILIVAAFGAVALSCGDDDDDSDDSDDDYTPYDDDDDNDDDNDGDDDDVDDDVDDDSFFGNCDTMYEYDAIEWLFEDCYDMGDAESICTETSPQQIDCFVDCYDSFDECGGDVDPMFDCLEDCFDVNPDDDFDDDDDDFNPVGDCDTQDVYDAMGWLFEDCYELEDGGGNVMDADEVCESAGAGTIGCFMDCYDAANECGGDPDPLFDCLAGCLA